MKLDPQEILTDAALACAHERGWDDPGYRTCMEALTAIRPLISGKQRIYTYTLDRACGHYEPLSAMLQGPGDPPKAMLEYIRYALGHFGAEYEAEQHAAIVAFVTEEQRKAGRGERVS